MPGLVHMVSNNDCLLSSPLLHLQATLELLADHAIVLDVCVGHAA